MEILKNTLTPRELHNVLYLHINDVILNVKKGNKVGADILTAIGFCQGDSLSALLFIQSRRTETLMITIRPYGQH